MRVRPRPPEGVSPAGAVLFGIFLGATQTLVLGLFVTGRKHLPIAVGMGVVDALVCGFGFYFALRAVNTRAARRAGAARR